MDEVQLNEFLILHQRERKTTVPLAIVISWINSVAGWKSSSALKVLKKYTEELYGSRGFDILILKTMPHHCLRPYHGRRAAKRLVDLACTMMYTDRPVVFHIFSAGSYTCGEVLGHLARNPERYLKISRNLSGLVADSPAESTDVVQGISSVITSNINLDEPLRLAPLYYGSKALLALYLFVTGVWRDHEASASRVRDLASIIRRLTLASPLAPLPPALIVFGENDRVADCARIQQNIDRVKQEGLPIEGLRFSSSRHAAHMVEHPEEYMRAMTAFFARAQAHWESTHAPVSKL